MHPLCLFYPGGVPCDAPAPFWQVITNEGLRLACRLPSLTYLNASRCHGITVEGLSGLKQAAKTLQRLNLGWCKVKGAWVNRGVLVVVASLLFRCCFVSSAFVLTQWSKLYKNESSGAHSSL